MKYIIATFTYTVYVGTVTTRVYNDIGPSDTITHYNVLGEEVSAIPKVYHFDNPYGKKDITGEINYILNGIPEELRPDKMVGNNIIETEGDSFGTYRYRQEDFYVAPTGVKFTLVNHQPSTPLSLIDWETRQTYNTYTWSNPGSEGREIEPMYEVVVRSSRIVGSIEMSRAFNIVSAELRDIDGGALRYLSVDGESSQGDTRINGTVEIKGGRNDRIDYLRLEIIQDGEPVTLIDASRSAKQLFQKFGDDKTVSVNNFADLFRLSPSEQARFDVSENDNLSFRLHAQTVSGLYDVFNIRPSVQILTEHLPTRFGKDRDRDEGGDAWMLPSLVPFVDWFDTLYPELKFNDFSNMNGGHFRLHDAHRKGRSIDLQYDGYLDGITAKDARQLIEYINDDYYGKDIAECYVTFKRGGSFEKYINSHKLDNEKLASSVIKFREGHEDHFHWEVSI